MSSFFCCCYHNDSVVVNSDLIQLSIDQGVIQGISYWTIYLIYGGSVLVSLSMTRDILSCSFIFNTAQFILALFTLSSFTAKRIGLTFSISSTSRLKTLICHWTRRRQDIARDGERNENKLLPSFNEGYTDRLNMIRLESTIAEICDINNKDKDISPNVNKFLYFRTPNLKCVALFPKAKHKF